jgi:hypothetical protein
MKYLLLIYEREGARTPTEAEWQQEYAEYMALDNEAKQRGIFLDSQPLESVRTAKTLRVRNGQADVTDGPFAETREQLGGYYFLDCTKEEALEFAARIPEARYGAVEVRPVMVFG